MTHTVVSVGETLLFAGIGLGTVSARIAAIVVFCGAFRFTRCASGSVPVFTDQRSTPQANAARRGKRVTKILVSKALEKHFLSMTRNLLTHHYLLITY